MNKNTLSHYGWVIAAIIIVAILIALATPFAKSIKDNFIGMTNKFSSEGGDAWNVVDSAKEEYGGGGYDNDTSQFPLDQELKYFNTLSDAVNGVNGSTEKAGSNISTYTDESGCQYIVLLNDIETDCITISKDTVINLNGRTITCTDAAALDIVAGNTLISGTTSGSGIMSNGQVVNMRGESLTINGGSYTSNTSGAGTPTNSVGAITLADGTTVNISGATICANDSNGGTVSAVLGSKNTTIIASDCTIESTSKSGLEVAGVRGLGDVELTNCSVVAYADYTANAAGTAYATNSRGVYCEGNLTLTNCYVWGTHAGVTAKGNLTVNGGTYEGYGHGGIYCSGPTAYINDAAINWAAMKEGFIADNVAGTNGAGMYIGGVSNANVYFNNCSFYGTYYGVVVRGSGGEANNMVYISNSNMEFGRYSFRMSSYSSRLYIGSGNGFDKSTTDIPGNCIVTTDTYAY